MDPRWMLRQATDGLAFLHKLGWIHRNLKPTSFLIQIVSEGKYVIKLTDMRRSKYWMADTANSGTGDPVWKPPEICSAESLDLKMDIFVLGCCLVQIRMKRQRTYSNRIMKSIKTLGCPNCESRSLIKP